jgi:hypothetical protein
MNQRDADWWSCVAEVLAALAVGCGAVALVSEAVMVGALAPVEAAGFVLWAVGAVVWAFVWLHAWGGQ